MPDGQFAVAWRCPACQHRAMQRSWVVADLVRHPELRVQILGGTLNALDCPSCGQRSSATKSLLVDLDGRGPLAFAPDPDADAQRSREQLFMSLQLLQRAGAAAQRPVFGIDHELLPVLVTRDLAQDLAQLGEGRFEADTIALQAYGEWLASTLRTQRRNAAAGAVRELAAGAQTAEAFRQAIRRLPMLLSVEADGFLEVALDLASQEGSAEERRQWRTLRHILRRCREGDVDTALAACFAPVRPSGAPAGTVSGPLGAALLALDGGGPARSPDELRDLFEWALVRLPPELAELCSQLHEGEFVCVEDQLRLALAHNLLADGRGPGEARDARRLCRELFRLQATAPRTWASAQHRYALSWIRAHEDDRPAALEHAAAAYRIALGVWRPERDLHDWVRTVLGLAEVLRDVLPGERAAHLDEALRLLRDAEQQVPAVRAAALRAEVLHALGQVLMSGGQGRAAALLDEAIGALLEAVALRRADPANPRMDDVEQDLGIALCHRAELDGQGWGEAVAHLESALQGVDRQGMPLRWSEVAGNLAIALRHLPDDAGMRLRKEHALALLREVVAIQAEHGAWWAWAGNQNNLANTLLELPLADRIAATDEAVAAYQAALTVWTRARHPQEWALTTARLALAHARRAKWAGEPALREALHCYDEAYAALDPRTDPLAWTRVANRRAGLLVDLAHRAPAGEQLAQLRAAAAEYERAAAILGRKGAPVLWAGIRNNAGHLLLSIARQTQRAEDLNAAAQAFEDALDARPQSVAPLEWAQTTSGLAQAFAMAGNDAQALECLRAAEPVAQACESPEDVTRIARQCAELYAAAGRWHDAAAAGERALAAAEQGFEAAVLRGSREFEVEAVAQLAAGTAYSHARAGDADAAVRALERGRARLLSDGMALEAAFRADGAAGLAPEQLASWRAGLEAMRAADAAAVRLELEAEQAGPGRSHHRQLAERALRARREAAAATMRAMGRSTVTEPAAQETMDLLDRPVAWLLLTAQGGLVLAYWRGHIEAILAPGIDGPQLEAGLAAEGESGSLLDRQAAVDAAWGPSQREALGALLERVLPRLGMALCAPLARLLATWKAEAVYLVCCGRLGMLPLHAAPYDAGGASRCLMDDFAVSRVPSRTVLRAALSEARRRAPAAAQLVAVVDPRGNLPLAAVEVADLALREGEHMQVLAGAQAQRASVLQASCHATHLHFACHGRTLADQPLRSHLQLADGGALSLVDLLDATSLAPPGQPVPLAHARLVVASACQTAVNAGAHIPDEVVGLPAGFLQLGVPCYVGTLWPVTDLSSALFMTRFYEALLPGAGSAPLPADRALCATAAWLRELCGAGLVDYLEAHPALLAEAGAARALAERYPDRQFFAAPQYWAPYVCVGAPVA